MLMKKKNSGFAIVEKGNTATAIVGYPPKITAKKVEKLMKKKKKRK
jgi:hypothetical protein